MRTCSTKIPGRNRGLMVQSMEARILFNTYYVDGTLPSASDNNSGTSINVPFKTIDRALAAVSADNKSTTTDTVYIRGGTYREEPNVWASDSGASATNRTVISAYVNPSTGQYEPVYLDAADPLSGTWTRYGNTNIYYLSNFYTETAGVWVDWSSSNDGPSLQQIGTYNAGFPDERQIVGTNVSSMTPGTYYGDLSTGRLYVYLSDGSNPAAHTLEYANRSNAIYQPGTLTSNGYVYPSNLDFDGLKLRHGNTYNTYGQDPGSAIYTTNNERLINCDVEWNVGVGIVLRNNSQLIDTTSSNNGRNGVSAQGYGFLINGGSYDSNYWRNGTDASQAGIKVISASDSLYGTIENAEIAYNYGKGIWYDTQWQNSAMNYITGNYIHDNQQQAIDLEASENFVVANNVITNNQGDGIFLNAAENSSIFNNTVVGNASSEYNMAAIELDGGARMEGNVEVGTFNNAIYNNIIADNSSVYDLDIPTTSQPQWAANNISDYNLFYRSSGTLHFTDGGAYLGWADQPTTLSGWQSVSQLDAHSQFGDPMFVGGTGATAYQIAANSPAIGYGANLSSTINTDFAGTARPNAAFDVGAFQHAVTASPGKLTGTPIGTPTSWLGTTDTIASVFDGNLYSYYDAQNSNLSNWVGLDLGTYNDTITQVKVAPRPGYAFRMVYAQIQVSNIPDFSSGVVTIGTITNAPPVGQLTTINVTPVSGYRYIRYVGGNQWVNIAEMEVDGGPTNSISGTTVGTSNATAANSIGTTPVVTSNAPAASNAGATPVVTSNPPAASSGETNTVTNGPTYTVTARLLSNATQGLGVVGGYFVQFAPSTVSSTVQADLTQLQTDQRTLALNIKALSKTQRAKLNTDDKAIAAAIKALRSTLAPLEATLKADAKAAAAALRKDQLVIRKDRKNATALAAGKTKLASDENTFFATIVKDQGAIALAINTNDGVISAQQKLSTDLPTIGTDELTIRSDQLQLVADV